MKKLYCISGLGADHRIFQNLLIPGYEIVPLPWAVPDAGDTLATYALKMSALIADERPIILGVSMGGMIATEIGKIRETEKIIIVSSAKTGAEVGPRFWLTRQLAIWGIVPARLLTIPYPFVLTRLGVKSREERKLVCQVIKDANPLFVKWAVKAIVQWNATTWPSNVYHIHGTADKVIPSKGVTPNEWIEGGTHMMVLNRAKDVNKLVSECLWLS